MSANEVTDCALHCACRLVGCLPRHKLHNLYDALLRRFVMVGNDLACGDHEAMVGGPEGASAELDATVGVLFEMAHELTGEAVLGLWRRYLGEAQTKLTRLLRDDGARVSQCGVVQRSVSGGFRGLVHTRAHTFTRGWQ